ncbi:MAG TPA: hypothetical protein VMF08_05895 [Candidatus Sulfotelmatobacter sp.]|nr:hypothetical protein [Candidatus Sulfotelmatobacter sp.]
MKKSSIAITIAIAVFALNHALSQTASATATATAISNGYGSYLVPQQQFPFIIYQPDDQCVTFGSTATFSVTALNAQGYQWLCNGNVLPNATNNTLTIQNAQIGNVGLYSCDIYKGLQSIPTRTASLEVYTNWIDPKTGVDPVVVYSFPYPGGGSQNTCPGPYNGYVAYTLPYTNGWGWTPDTTNGNTLFTATDTNASNTKVEYLGEYGDSGCNQTTVTIPNPPISPAYEFCIYFTNGAPTGPYPIYLSGFNPAQ